MPLGPMDTADNQGGSDGFFSNVFTRENVQAFADNLSTLAGAGRDLGNAYASWRGATNVNANAPNVPNNTYSGQANTTATGQITNTIFGFDRQTVIYAGVALIALIVVMKFAKG